jgi:Flp pilus assembly protein TadD
MKYQVWIAAILAATVLFTAQTASAQTSAISYYNSGTQKYKQGDHNGAISDFTRAIEINPGYWKAYNSRGVVKWDKGDLDGALSDHTKSIELNPENAAAYATAASSGGTGKISMAPSRIFPAPLS